MWPKVTPLFPGACLIGFFFSFFIHWQALVEEESTKDCGTQFSTRARRNLWLYVRYSIQETCGLWTLAAFHGDKLYGRTTFSRFTFSCLFISFVCLWCARDFTRVQGGDSLSLSLVFSIAMLVQAPFCLAAENHPDSFPIPSEFSYAGQTGVIWIIADYWIILKMSGLNKFLHMLANHS